MSLFVDFLPARISLHLEAKSGMEPKRICKLSVRSLSDGQRHLWGGDNKPSDMSCAEVCVGVFFFSSKLLH